MTTREIIKSWDRVGIRGASDGPRVTYKPVKRLFVPFDVEMAADAALAVACADLGLKWPQVLWLEKALHDGRHLPPEIPTLRTAEFVVGVADRSAKAIGISAHLTHLEAAEIAAHEAYHLTQPEGADDEADAIAYGQKISGIYAEYLRGRAARGELPAIHQLDHCPGGANYLHGVAERGDILLAPDQEKSSPEAWLNVGLKRSPRWMRLASMTG